MIEIYGEIGTTIAAVDSIKWVDIGPRFEAHTNLYPAAYIFVDDTEPLSLMGRSTFSDLSFRVEIWVKPYNSSAVKPLSPALEALRENLSVVEEVRKAVYSLTGPWVRGTTLLSEVPVKMEDGFYRITQRWGASTAYTMPEHGRLAKIPKLEFEENP